MNKELAEFMDKNAKVILISFGTLMRPVDEKLKGIFEFVRMR